MSTRKVPPQDKRCQMRREDGKQCRAARLKESRYCLFHHPWTQKRREKFEKVEELPLRQRSDIHELLVEAVRSVEAGRMNAQQAYALGWLLRLLRENLKGVEEEQTLYKEQGMVEAREPEFGEGTEGSAAEARETTTEAEAGEEEGSDQEVEE